MRGRYFIEMEDGELVDALDYRRRKAESARWVDPDRTRTKDKFPYSYDEFFVWGSRDSIQGCEAMYNDRIWEWDRAKADALWAKHVGCRWDQAQRRQVNAFLSEYLGKPVTSTAVAEGCNPATQYPYWIVWYREPERIEKA